MNETRYDPAEKPDDWDEEAYEQAERAWRSWCEREAEETDAEDEQLSEEEKLMRAEKRRLIAERHDEEKQRRLEMIMRGEETWQEQDEVPSEKEPKLSWQEEYRLEREREIREGGNAYEYTAKLLVIFATLVGMITLIGWLVYQLLC